MAIATARGIIARTTSTGNAVTWSDNVVDIPDEVLQNQGNLSTCLDLLKARAGTLPGAPGTIRKAILTIEYDVP